VPSFLSQRVAKLCAFRLRKKVFLGVRCRLRR
jgi:hypothetical protein